MWGPSGKGKRRSGAPGQPGDEAGRVEDLQRRAGEAGGVAGDDRADAGGHRGGVLEVGPAAVEGGPEDGVVDRRDLEGRQQGGDVSLRLLGADDLPGDVEDRREGRGREAGPQLLGGHFRQDQPGDRGEGGAIQERVEDDVGVDEGGAHRYFSAR